MATSLACTVHKRTGAHHSQGGGGWAARQALHEDNIATVSPSCSYHPPLSLTATYCTGRGLPAGWVLTVRWPSDPSGATRQVTVVVESGTGERLRTAAIIGDDEQVCRVHHSAVAVAMAARSRPPTRPSVCLSVLTVFVCLFVCLLRSSPRDIYTPSRTVPYRR